MTGFFKQIKKQQKAKVWEILQKLRFSNKKIFFNVLQKDQFLKWNVAIII